MIIRRQRNGYTSGDGIVADQVPGVEAIFRRTLEQLEAILAHELAHVRRHDFLVNIVQSLIEIVFFYHPAVWLISAQVRREREQRSAIAGTAARRLDA